MTLAGTWKKLYPLTEVHPKLNEDRTILLESPVIDCAPNLPQRAATPDKKLTFLRDSGFYAELRRRVDDYFVSSGHNERDCWPMYLKTAILFSCLAAAYGLLVFVAQAWWQALPLAALLGLSAAAIGFNVQHDGGHNAYSNRPWINRLMARSLDVLGGSSYIWHWKHAVLHHTYANITGHDTDIELGLLGRLSPHQPRLPFHRWQHIYLWPLYGMMAMKWHFFDDFRQLAEGRLGEHAFPRPTRSDLLVFVAGKMVFFTLLFGIPLMFHSIGVVLAVYAVTAIVLGMVLSIVFQLAHSVEEAEFPLPRADTGTIENTWAIHQVETTVDFARSSRAAAWFLGGLNFQIEHHLFPRVCHVHYPAISQVVEATCREYGVRYAEHGTFSAGLGSHFRWLRRMGQPNPRVEGRVEDCAVDPVG
ncbi:MAG: acyl-CoA desaturase [Planctomycetaceae bacterium]|nr:acyl-CoA desaturase [Planctomycetaceae bacterium]